VSIGMTPSQHFCNFSPTYAARGIALIIWLSANHATSRLSERPLILGNIA
jgi:hypothetical protein